MTQRKRYTHKDVNHFIPRDYLRDRCGGFEFVKYGNTRTYTANYRGNQFVLFDMSDYGGVFSDWLLFCIDRDEYRWIEVKTAEAHRKPNHDTTPGEWWLGLKFGGAFQFVVTDEDFEAILEGMI